MKNKVKVIITDSPLLNSIVYYNGGNPHFEPLVIWEFTQMNNFTLYLERSFEYVENGRMQTLEGAKKVDEAYKTLLDKYKINYTLIRSPYDVDSIVQSIIDKINE